MRLLQLANGGYLRRAIQKYPIPSSSRLRWCRWFIATPRNSASFGNPISWFREKLTPTVREKSSEQEVAAAREQAEAEGNRSIFKTVVTKPTKGTITIPKKKATHHKYSTANFKISHRKLNDLGRQIAGKPIDHAILQMTFSEKRASKRIKSMLVVARDHAINYKRLDHSKLIVAESWVTKGPNCLKRSEPRGRGHHGIRVHPDSKMHVVLKEGKTFEQRAKDDRARKIKRIVSASLVREDRPLRNPGPMWGW